MLNKIVDVALAALIIFGMVGFFSVIGMIGSEEYWKRESLKALFVRHDCAAALRDGARAGYIQYEITRVCVDR